LKNERARFADEPLREADINGGSSENGKTERSIDGLSENRKIDG
jgi:hypothetical protein